MPNQYLPRGFTALRSTGSAGFVRAGTTSYCLAAGRGGRPGSLGRFVVLTGTTDTIYGTGLLNAEFANEADTTFGASASRKIIGLSQFLFDINGDTNINGVFLPLANPGIVTCIDDPSTVFQGTLTAALTAAQLVTGTVPMKIDATTAVFDTDPTMAQTDRPNPESNDRLDAANYNPSITQHAFRLRGIAAGVINRDITSAHLVEFTITPGFKA